MHHGARGTADADLAVARLAARQRGLATRAQLEACGLGRGAIAFRVRSGRLHLVHRGVYLVGHAVPPPLALELAALLACGPGAVLSHRSAAVLWEMLPGMGGTAGTAGAAGTVDVTIAGRRIDTRSGIRAHRSPRLGPNDLARRHRIAVTSPARTLLDFAEVAAAGSSSAHSTRRRRDGS